MLRLRFNFWSTKSTGHRSAHCGSSKNVFACARTLHMLHFVPNGGYKQKSDTLWVLFITFENTLTAADRPTEGRIDTRIFAMETEQKRFGAHRLRNCLWYCGSEWTVWSPLDPTNCVSVCISSSLSLYVKSQTVLLFAVFGAISVPRRQRCGPIYARTYPTAQILVRLSCWQNTKPENGPIISRAAKWKGKFAFLIRREGLHVVRS